jgi:hypothetical protein
MSKMTAVTMVSNLGVVTRASESDRCPMGAATLSTLLTKCCSQACTLTAGVV